nr:PREDICTED: uncharacterized protein LOC107076638 [Lepisosteus oculatus]
MGQSSSSYSAATSAKAKGKSAERAAANRRMKIRRIAGEERRDDRFDRNAVKKKESPRIAETLRGTGAAEAGLNGSGDPQAGPGQGADERLRAAADGTERGRWGLQPGTIGVSGNGALAGGPGDRSVDETRLGRGAREDGRGGRGRSGAAEHERYGYKSPVPSVSVAETSGACKGVSQRALPGVQASGPAAALEPEPRPPMESLA